MRQPSEYLRESCRRRREAQGLPMEITDPRVVMAIRAVLSEHADQLARERAEPTSPRGRRAS